MIFHCGTEVKLDQNITVLPINLPSVMRTKSTNEGTDPPCKLHFLIFLCVFHVFSDISATCISIKKIKRIFSPYLSARLPWDLLLSLLYFACVIKFCLKF